jgi:hypothetical protein
MDYVASAGKVPHRNVATQAILTPPMASALTACATLDEGKMLNPGS